jgi:hypothetical protein
MESYPIIIIPKKLKQIDEDLPSLPKKPTEPLSPKKRTNLPIEPTFTKVEEPKFSKSENGCFWYPLIGGIILFLVFVGMDDPGEFAFFIILSVIVSLIGYWGLKSSSKENDDKYKKYIEDSNAFPKLMQAAKNKYLTDFVKYDKALAKIEHEYKEKVKLFKEYEYPMYIANLKTYEKEIERLNRPEEVKKHRIKERNKFFETVMNPSVHPTIDDIKKGASEEDFLSFLIERFGNIVFQNYTVAGNHFNRPYLPDFTIYDRNIGYCIDVEIDEPYIGSNGKPIHFTDSLHDKKRDNYFARNGWVIIRFAEKQVIENPNDCCNIIAETINKICKDLTEFEINQEIILSPLKQWTKDEAHEMAFKRERNKYLKTNLIEKLNKEQHESSEEYIEEIPKEEEEVIINIPEPKNQRNYGDDLPF